MIVKTLWGEELQESKVCKKCGVEKLVSEFQPRPDLSYVRGECKACARKLNKERHFLKKFHPYPKNHRCDMCKKTEEEAMGFGGSKSKAFCIDHNHKTGEFRGWLCHNCNRSFGQIGEDTEVLISAIIYNEGSVDIAWTKIKERFDREFSEKENKNILKQTDITLPL